MSAAALDCRRITAEQVYTLRGPVIIAGTGRTSPVFVGDDAPDTTHFGGYLGEELVVCFTIMSVPWEGQPAWRLRGMATHAEHRQRGYGRALLDFAIPYLRGLDERRTLWCDARKVAIPFYERCGWRIVSEEYDIPNIGPHVKMLVHF